MYWQLFSSFFRIGAFTIGGGYAMIPLIQREVVDNKGWIPKDQFLDMLALAQSAPGVIAVNTAIFTGYKIKGVRGALASTLGCILPSFLIILLIAAFFVDIKDNAVVERIFKGIRPAVVALIAAPVWNMIKSIKFSWDGALLLVGGALLIWLLDLSPVYVIIIAIVWGLFSGSIRDKKRAKDNKLQE